MELNLRYITHLDDIKDISNKTLKTILTDVETFRLKKALRDNTPMIMMTVEKNDRLNLRVAGSFEDTATLALEGLMLLLSEHAETLSPDKIGEMYEAVIRRLTDNCDEATEMRERQLALDEMAKDGEPLAAHIRLDRNYQYDSTNAVGDFSRTPSGARAVQSFSMIDAAQAKAFRMIEDVMGEKLPEKNDEQIAQGAEELVSKLYYENGSPRIINEDNVLTEDNIRERLKPGVIVTAVLKTTCRAGAVDVTIKGKFAEYDKDDNPRIIITEQLDNLSVISMLPNQIVTVYYDDIVAIEAEDDKSDPDS